MKMIAVALAAAALSGCMAPIITAPGQSRCADLLPERWKEGVDGAPLPEGDEVADWITFGDAQTGRLDQANGRTTDSIEIVERCEERQREAVQRAKPWWQKIF